jgi:hypothetical protein
MIAAHISRPAGLEALGRRHGSLTERAIVNTGAGESAPGDAAIRRVRSPRIGAPWTGLALLALVAATSACHRESEDGHAIQASSSSPSSAGVAGASSSPSAAGSSSPANSSSSSSSTDASAKAKVAELIETLTPLTKTVTSDITDKKFIRGQELLAEMRKGGTAVGVAALDALRSKQAGEKAWPVDVERGLLDVAAHAAPNESRQLLTALVTQYGPTLELRTHALVLLSETWPEDTLKILEPLVTKARPNQTLPPAEFMVDAWVTACEKTGRSPVKVLADVATNLFMDETARIRAVKDLGHYKDPFATQALSAILVESTGDAYLRRMAAQGLRDTLDRETACKIFETVASREADLGMLDFMRDMLDKNCAELPEKKGAAAEKKLDGSDAQPSSSGKNASAPETKLGLPGSGPGSTPNSTEPKPNEKKPE